MKKRILISLDDPYIPELWICTRCGTQNHEALIGCRECKTKRDMRPRLGLWAPGTHSNECIFCGSQFIGNKEAKICASCAYKNK